jgi:hypothetical protein
MDDSLVLDDKSRLIKRIKRLKDDIRGLEDLLDSTRNPLERRGYQQDIELQGKALKGVLLEYEALNNQAPHQQQQNLDTLIQKMPLSPLAAAPLFTVNCNRREEYSKLTSHFKEKESDDRNLFYLLSACDSQKPGSLAKRLIYDFVESHEVLYFSKPNSPYVEVEDLLLTQQFQEPWKKIWKFFNTYFQKKENSDFENFIQQKVPWRTGNYRIALTFFIEEIFWNSTDPCRFIQFVIDQLARVPEGQRRFMFFFICDFSSVHCTCLPEQEKYLCNLDELVAQNNASGQSDRALLHVKLLPPVAEKEVKVWVNAVLDKNKTKNPGPVLKALCESLEDEDESNQYKNKNEYDMRRVEEMQLIFHQFAKERYQEKKQKGNG